MSIQIVGLAIFGILFLLSKKENAKDAGINSTFLKPFYKVSSFLYERFINEKKNSYIKRTENIFALLQPGTDYRNLSRNFFLEKMSMLLLLLFLGLVFSLMLQIKENSGSLLEEGYRLPRNEAGGESYKVNLNAVIGEEEVKNIEVIVRTKHYTKEELQQLAQEFVILLEKDFLSENQTVDFVNKDVSLPKQIEGFPFTVEWEWEEVRYINRRGNLQEGIPENGQVMLIKANITCEDFAMEHSFAIRVYPKESTLEEALNRKIEEILQADEGNGEWFDLPENFDGMQIRWTEKKKSNSFILLMLTFIAAIAVFFAKDKDLQKKLTDREEQMKADYPEIVSKLTLYIGAGMTVRGAFRKIAEEYRQRINKEKRYAYEEMILMLREMDSGVDEKTAYRHFSIRCRQVKYVKMISLLEQNLKRGSKDLIKTLQEETRDAFEERKNNAQKAGEEAGTKLLLPMFMMLLIVMVVIMVPAFMSM